MLKQFVLVIIVAASCLGHAHDHHDHHHHKQAQVDSSNKLTLRKVLRKIGIKLKEPEGEHKKSKVENYIDSFLDEIYREGRHMKEIMDELHHEFELEGAHDKSRVKRFIAATKKLNPKTFYLLASKVNNNNLDKPEKTLAAKNFVAMVSTTESAELSAIGVAWIITKLFEFSEVTANSIIAAGLAISTPSFETICLASICLYPMSKRYRNAVTNYRIWAVKKIKKLRLVLGLNRDLISEATKNGWLIQWNEDNPSELSFEKENEMGDVFLRVEMLDDIYVKEIAVNNQDQDTLRKTLNILPWSTREIIVQNQTDPSFSITYDNKLALIKENESCDTLITASNK